MKSLENGLYMAYADFTTQNTNLVKTHSELTPNLSSVQVGCQPELEHKEDQRLTDLFLILRVEGYQRQ